MTAVRFKPSLLAALLASSLFQAAWAVEPFVLKDIRVEGLQRADAGTVFASLPFRVGDTYTDDKGAAGLRSLFATGLFKDVRIQIDGKVVVVVVEERPVISRVEFVGTKEFDKDNLIKALKDVGIGEGQPFDRALADRAEQELKRQYLTRSLYGVEVVTTITPAERNRVNVTFTVTEGEVTKIKSIRITGNQAFSESALLSQMDLTVGGWLTWYTKSDQYARAKLNADLESIKAYYLNRGYLEFRIDSTQVAISPDKQDISIAINVTEGPRYVITGVKLDGDYVGKEDTFRKLVTIKPGEAYRAEDVASTIKAFTDRFAAFGYAFAKVEFRPELDREKGQAVAVLVAQPQRRVYVRRVNVAGNSRTRDEVIRREFRQFEAAWYDGQKIKLSRDRVDRLGYFKQVNIETTEVPGTADQVDLTISVEEKPTGNLMLGAGFSSAEKFTLTASVKQDNVFGTGNYLGVELNTSKYNRTIVVSTVDPYFTDNGVSRSYDVYYRTSRPLSTQGGDYEIVTPGAKVNFGVPYTEFDTVFFGVGAEQTAIHGTTGLPLSYQIHRETFGERSLSIPLTTAWQRDSRDSVIAPSSGRYQRINLEWGALGDTRYLRSDYQFQQHFALTNRYTFSFNGELAYGIGLQGRPYPVFKNWSGGGLGSVRGFEQGTLGPIDALGASIGGNKRINLNHELYVPFPGAGNDRTLRLFGYVDAGNVWGENEPIKFKDFRASTGVGISWVSPVGPLKLSYGKPFRYFDQDKIQKLQFQIGTAF
ncbi:MAG: outer membrane protein assembly factor BamA [Aquabacterium sp.]|uniref:outer membrane protein assembly factor BamA n=1 Tax=Aquabacterium sp. TaxID=1872578 RepID=UPI0011F5A54E|nr:outer membrane protein assembly factor BamA [Aquabacterium sp.]TAK85813.1 MAG: outer membrane protein assembly factor BamA [Aquabacterium sp.]